VAVLVVGAILRIALASTALSDPGRVLFPDSFGYLELADGLRASGRFERLHADGSFGGPETFRTPGYPALLALLGPAGVQRIQRVLTVQVVLGLLIVLAGYRLGRRWNGERAGLLSALVLALDPTQVVYASAVMSDIPCAAAVAIAFLLALHTRDPGPLAAAAAGCMLAAATALRPVCAPLGLFVAGFLWYRGRRRPAMILLLLAASWPAAWVVRNGIIARSWTPSTAFEFNLSHVVAARTLAHVQRLSRQAAEAQMRGRIERARSENPRAPLPAIERRVGLAVLAAHPGAAAAELAAASAEMLLAGERRYLLQLLGRDQLQLASPSVGEARTEAGVTSALLERSRGERILVLSQAAFQGTVWCLALLGLRRWARDGDGDLGLAVALAIVSVLAPSLVVGSGRMRLPVVIAVAFAAGAAARRARPRTASRSAAPGVGRPSADLASSGST